MTLQVMPNFVRQDTQRRPIPINSRDSQHEILVVEYVAIGVIDYSHGIVHIGRLNHEVLRQPGVE
jgi:hypothetical protein